MIRNNRWIVYLVVMLAPNLLGAGHLAATAAAEPVRDQYCADCEVTFGPLYYASTGEYSWDVDFGAPCHENDFSCITCPEPNCWWSSMTVYYTNPNWDPCSGECDESGGGIEGEALALLRTFVEDGDVGNLLAGWQQVSSVVRVNYDRHAIQALGCHGQIVGHVAVGSDVLDALAAVAGD